MSRVSRIVMWDPAKGLADIKDKKGYFEPATGKYVLQWGKEVLLSREFVEEWKGVNVAESAGRITRPCYYVFAGAHDSLPVWKEHVGEYYIVEGASHRFIEKGAEEELFDATLKWLEKSRN